MAATARGEWKRFHLWSIWRQLENMELFDLMATRRGFEPGRESVARRPFVGKRLGFAAAASVTDHQDGVIGLR